METAASAWTTALTALGSGRYASVRSDIVLYRRERFPITERRRKEKEAVQECPFGGRIILQI